MTPEEFARETDKAIGSLRRNYELLTALVEAQRELIKDLQQRVKALEDRLDD
ncbi:hypothetical protein [Nocardioides sp. KR10-350]|uniref:hypothetical protein n=1 Tax=Nocardioides cheoyonin TaxID=3156615 RepID=UPI0032B423D1